MRDPIGMKITQTNNKQNE